MQVYRGRFSPLFRDSAGVPEPLALPCTLHVNSREDHGELRLLKFDAVGFVGAGHLEGPGLESLVPDGQTVAIEVEDLDPISAAVDEEEEMAGQGILAEALLDQPGEAVETVAHVDGAGAEEDTDGGGKHDHGVASDLLICGILMWHRVRRFGFAGERVDESQVGARIGELGRVEMFQQMSDCEVGPRVRHRMDMHTQNLLLHIRQQVGLGAIQIAQQGAGVVRPGQRLAHD